jgi:hypothetical protein
MKTKNPQVEYGPETPGYAQLNEQLRRDRSAEKPKKLSKSVKGKSQPNANPT